MTASRAADEIRDLVLPLVDALGCRLYDLELSGSGRARTLRVLIDRDGGVDLEAITAATQAISAALDTSTAISGPFLLEVSSPGLERPLRRPEHFAGAIGETVTISSHTDSGPERRRGTLVDAGEHACVVEIDGEREEIAYDVDHARRARCSSGAPSRADAKKKQDAPRAPRRRHEKSGDARGALGARSREGDFRRDHARGVGERARHRVQAHARSRRGSARRDRRRDR